MRLGIYEKAINNKFSLAEKIDVAKAAGFDFIELSIDESEEKMKRLSWSEEQIKEVRRLLITKDFMFNSMALSGLRKFPYGSHDPKVREKAVEITAKAIKLAKLLGIRNIQLAGYDVYYEEGDALTAAWFMEGVKKVVKMAERESVMLSFEVMDTPFMGTVSKVMEIVKAVNSPYLQIYPDLGNLWQHTDNATAELAFAKGHIVGIHFKDTLPKKYRDVTFGKGNVDFKVCMQALKDISYEGPCLIEMWSANNLTETKEQAIAYIQTAKDFFLKSMPLNGFLGGTI